MAMFSFTNVENWRTVNFLPKCTRLHQIASQIPKFSRGDTPGPPSLGRGTPLPQILPPQGASFFWVHQGLQSLNPALMQERVYTAGPYSNWLIWSGAWLLHGLVCSTMIVIDEAFHQRHAPVWEMRIIDVSLQCRPIFHNSAECEYHFFSIYFAEYRHNTNITDAWCNND